MCCLVICWNNVKDMLCGVVRYGILFEIMKTEAGSHRINIYSARHFLNETACKLSHCNAIFAFMDSINYLNGYGQFID